MSSLLDEFDRPDSTTLGAQWVEGSHGAHVNSGAAVPDSDSSTNFARHAVALASGDQEVQFEQGNAAGGAFVGVAARMPAFTELQGTTSVGSMYLLLRSSSGTSLSIRRKEANSSTLTTLASGTAPFDVSVDSARMWLRVVEPTPGTVNLYGYALQAGTTNYVLVVQATDTSGLVPATQRHVGLWASGTGATLQRFGIWAANDYVPPASDTVSPSTPTGLTATAASGGGVVLAWNASTDNTAVISYRVRRNGADLAGAGAVTGQSYTDSSAGAGTWTYTVSAVDAAGNRSAESASASATISPVDTTPPPVPGGLTATAGTAQVALSWTAVVDPGDLVGYRVYRGTTASPSTLIATVNTGQAHTDTGVTAGTGYYYAVSSYDQAGNESAKSTVAGPATPTAPAGGGLTGLTWYDGTTEATVVSAGWYDGTSESAVVSTETT